MIFKKTKLQDAFMISLKRLEDDRGFFARAWCSQEFEAQGISANLVQANISFNHKKGTLRGLHYQTAPKEEAKLVRCFRGEIYDVIIDLRPGSPTYCQWLGVKLTAESRDMLYVPEGFAHGFQTLDKNTEVFYLVTEYYSPEYEKGIRYNDPGFTIRWPMAVEDISAKDQQWPDYLRLTDASSPGNGALR